jgi:NADH dehydrogenase [ubiquinone] 1 alpha subcomplex assembly factor 7
MKAHGYVPVLAEPGEADITAHVDFQALGNAAIGMNADVHGPVGQGEFLKALGIEVRAAMLGKRGTPEEVGAALKRLTDDDQMGMLFKVMAVTQTGAPAPAGFA